MAEKNGTFYGVDKRALDGFALSLLPLLRDFYESEEGKRILSESEEDNKL